MSITLNEKGAVEQRVNLIKRGKGFIQHVMLNTVLIKKAENYALVTDRFLTNHLPAIMQDSRTIMEIYPRRDVGNAHVGYNNVPAQEYLENISEFTPDPCYSIARFCEALATFARDFNFGLNMQGANYSNINENNNAYNDFWITRHNILLARDTFPLEHHPIDLGNYVEPYEIDQHIAIGFDSDGSIQMSFSCNFLSNFFIALDPIFAKQVGFPVLIYAVWDAPTQQVIMSNQPGAASIFDPAGNNFVLTSQIPDTANGKPRTIQSTNSVYRVDDRLSIDVEISLPLRKYIDVLDGAEKHTFVLNRFVVTDYISVEAKIQQKGGVLLTKSVFQDKLNTGFQDLVNDRPASHAAKLMNGKIQELDIRLVKRYKQFRVENEKLKFKIMHDPFELEEHGQYDVLLSFNKRV